MPAVYDPPRVFDAGGEVLGSFVRDFFYLDTDRIYLLETQESDSSSEVQPADVTVYGVATSDRSELRLDAVPAELNQILMVELSDQVDLFTAYPYIEAGVGTATDTTYLRVQRYSLAEGALRWSVDVPTTDIESLGYLQLVAVNDQHLAISARERETPGAEISRGSTGVVLDSGTGAVRWIRSRFIPYALAGDVVAGTTPKPDRREEQDNTVEGRDARTGDVVWTFSGAEISRDDDFGFPVGTDLVQINTHNGLFFGEGVATAHLVDMATGDTVLELDRRDDARVPAFLCRHDGEDLIVCDTGELAGFRSMVGVDASDYRQLWTFDEDAPGREVPRMVGVRRGVVYVDVAVTLDGRTGEDLDVNLGVIPEYVGPGYVLAYDDDDLLVLYRATG